MKMMKRKKGMSHLELIVAILIFIFAVVSVIYFINLKTATPIIIISESHLDILEAGLREEAELDFNETLLYIHNIPDSNDDCFSVSKHSSLENQDFVFIAANNQPVAFEFSEDELLIENTGENLYKIYSFPADVINENPLEPLIPPCHPLPEGDYDYSISYRSKIFTQKNLLDLKYEYDNNYESLKEDFGFSNKDFSIIIKNEESGLVIEMTKLKSAAVEVQAREFSAEIVKEDGTIIKNCRINIQIW